MKVEIKNAIMKMLSDDATVTELCDTAENSTCITCEADIYSLHTVKQ